MSFECGEACTKLRNYPPPSIRFIPIDKAVKGCLRDLGSTSLTYGGLRHELAMRIVPKCILQYFINKSAPEILRLFRLE